MRLHDSKTGPSIGARTTAIAKKVTRAAPKIIAITPQDETTTRIT